MLGARRPREQTETGALHGIQGPGRQSSTGTVLYPSLGVCITEHIGEGEAPQPGTPQYPESWETGEEGVHKPQGPGGPGCSPQMSSESEGEHLGTCRGPVCLWVPPLFLHRETHCRADK